MGNTVLLDLVGGVSLLLWGLHMVHSGIMRAYGARIKKLLASVLKNRVQSFVAGIGVTVLLQSSTATALLLSSFSASGWVDLGPALAVMLGANVGTALIVQLLSFNTSLAAPLLLFLGVIAFRRGAKTVTRDLGRVSIGLGLMLLSLHMLLDSLAPAENAPMVLNVLGAMTSEPLLNLLTGALLSWAAHSSVATVLLVMSLGYSHFITPEAALALVMGANLGSALNPLWEGMSRQNPAQWRLPVGNLLNRLAGCLVFLPFVDQASAWLQSVDPNPVRMIADFHVLFNLLLALAFIFPVNAMARALQRMFPERKPQNSLGTPLYLDESVLQIPSMALACAARETLRMGDIVESMLRQSMVALLENDRTVVNDVSKLDNAVDSLHEAIKLYIVKLTRDSLDDAEGRRTMEIMALSINLEHIGDIIDKNLMELANKKIKRQSRFSTEGARELEEFHRIVTDNLKLALSVFVSGDVKLARQLLTEKSRIRQLEMAASENHFSRLREGRLESMDTSSLHLDVLRDLKRIHSHICAAAYPALEAAGELSPTRLREHATETLVGRFKAP